MRVKACVGLLAVCLGLTGCSLFGKKPSSSPGASAQARPAAPPAGPAAIPTSGGSATPAGVNGILAGRVLDMSERPRSSTYIRVTLTPEGNQGAPIEQDVAADGQGYFTIQGLQPGRNYQLTARAPDGERLVAGMAWGRPPNVRVVIHMSEDYVTAATPAIPPLPSWPGKGAKPQDKAQAAGRPDQPAASLERPAPTGGAELGTPTQPTGAVNPGADFVKDPRAVVSVPAAINGPGGAPGATRPGSTFTSPTAADSSTCTVQGNRIVDFALKDMDGRSWDFHRDHKGKLVLLDFWGSWCPTCIQAMPLLKSWQDRYGPAGLEVIGIDYEPSATSPADQLRKVQNVLRLPALSALSYRILLGGDLRTDPLLSKLQVMNYPTLMLLDDSGQILFRCEGLDPQLENIIRQRLGIR